MAILQVISDNPKLSYVISKNPSAGMVIRPLRSGMLFGYFPKINGVVDEKSFVIHFRDGSDTISYKKHPDEAFEYLNASKYNNSRFLIDAIQEMFHSARTKDNPDDVPSEHTLNLNMIETDYKTIAIFARYFPELYFGYEEVSKDNYRVTFKGLVPMTFKRFISLVNLFGIFASLNSSDYIYVTEDMIRKYVKLANEIDAPYFIRYLIKIRMARGEKKFKAVISELEKSNKYKIKMTPGDTHDARIDWIKNRIGMERSILDIGVGIDFRYLKTFIRDIMAKGLKYYAIDTDPEVVEKVNGIARARGWDDNVEVFDSLDSFIEYYRMVIPGQKLDVICTEVLEHNHRQEALQIVDAVISELQPEKFLVTVPNRDFNVYYGLDEVFRHDDHKWEATLSDVKDLKEHRMAFGEYCSIGDCVDDIPVTFGIEYKMAY